MKSYPLNMEKLREAANFAMSQENLSDILADYRLASGIDSDWEAARIAYDKLTGYLTMKRLP